jgi:Tol biopolymer transport system component
MRARRVFPFMVFAIAGIGFACGTTLSESEDEQPPVRPSADADSDASLDASPAIVDAADAEPPKCDHQRAFDTPKELENINSADNDVTPTLTADELTIVFASRRNDAGDAKFYVAQRTTRTVPFDPPGLFGFYEPGDTDPMFSEDGLRLYFTSFFRGGTPEDSDIWVTERSSPNGIFGAAFAVPGPNTADVEFHPFPRAGGLWFGSIRKAGSRAIYFSPLGGGAFGPAVKVDGLDDEAVDDEQPVPSADGLSIFFASKRVPEKRSDIYFARRNATNEPFANPVAVTELNTPYIDAPSWLSPDGCRLYFVRGDENDKDVQILVAEKPPL